MTASCPARDFPIGVTSSRGRRQRPDYPRKTPLPTCTSLSIAARSAQSARRPCRGNTVLRPHLLPTSLALSVGQTLTSFAPYDCRNPSVLRKPSLPTNTTPSVEACSATSSLLPRRRAAAPRRHSLPTHRATFQPEPHLHVAIFSSLLVDISKPTRTIRLTRQE